MERFLVIRSLRHRCDPKLAHEGRLVVVLASADDLAVLHLEDVDGPYLHLLSRGAIRCAASASVKYLRNAGEVEGNYL